MDRLHSKSSQVVGLASERPPDGLHLSFGGTGFSPTKLLALTTALVVSDYQVIVSTGSVADPEMFPKNINDYSSKISWCWKNIATRWPSFCVWGLRYLEPGSSVLQNRLLVFLNPDQMIHGLRFQELGLGKCLFHFDVWSAWNLVRFQLGWLQSCWRNLFSKRLVEAVWSSDYLKDQFKNRQVTCKNFASDQSAQKQQRTWDFSRNLVKCVIAGHICPKGTNRLFRQ